MNRFCPGDSLVAAEGPDSYWVGPFEDDITELGIRAARWETEENDGGNTPDLMLASWAELGYGYMASPWDKADPPCRICSGCPPAGFICAECLKGTML